MGRTMDRLLKYDPEINDNYFAVLGPEHVWNIFCGSFKKQDQRYSDPKARNG